MPAFDHRTAVVGGATGAIGGAIARRLAAAGAGLLLLGRDRAKLEKLESELGGSSATVASIAGDLTQESALERIGTAVAERFGGVDILIHALGLFRAGAIGDAEVSDLDRQYQVNVRAPFRLTQLLLPSLKSRQGQVVFINSNAGLQAQATVGAYSASKHALKALADSLRAEVNADGVRVLSVFPGRTASEMQRRVCEHLGQAYDAERLMTPDDVAAPVVEALLLPRSVEMTELRMRPMKKP